MKRINHRHPEDRLSLLSTDLLVSGLVSACLLIHEHGLDDRAPGLFRDIGLISGELCSRFPADRVAASAADPRACEPVDAQGTEPRLEDLRDSRRARCEPLRRRGGRPRRGSPSFPRSVVRSAVELAGGIRPLARASGFGLQPITKAMSAARPTIDGALGEWCAAYVGVDPIPAEARQDAPEPSPVAPPEPEAGPMPEPVEDLGRAEPSTARGGENMLRHEQRRRASGARLKERMARRPAPEAALIASPPIPEQRVVRLGILPGRLRVLVEELKSRFRPSLTDLESRFVIAFQKSGLSIDEFIDGLETSGGAILLPAEAAG
ncbi:MAG: hypothetical protein MH204_12745 [Fimbriimonadaceae bacterium]|nr:hypothetical protein [Fimbriimonadaceae bacterium]